MEKAFVRKGRRANTGLYLILLALFIGGLMLVLTTDDTKTISIITGIACGGIASVIVAWIIDWYTCKTENQRSTAVRQLYFGDLIFDLQHTLHYIPVAMKISDKDKHTWLEWVNLVDENYTATDGAKGVQNDWIKRTKDDITSILDQKLSVLSLGLITNDEMQILFEIRTSLTALEGYFIINPASGGFDSDYLKLVGKDLFENIQKTRIVAFLNDEKFELKSEEKMTKRDERIKGNEVLQA